MTLNEMARNVSLEAIVRTSNTTKMYKLRRDYDHLIWLGQQAHDEAYQQLPSRESTKLP